MRHAMLTLALWTATASLALAQGMYTPVVDECQSGCQSPYCDFGCTAPACYAGVRVGFFQQKRDSVYQFGSVANNANGIGPYILNTPSFGLTDWAALPEVVFGVELGDYWAVEGRFAYAHFEGRDNYLQAADNDPTVMLYIPFIDAQPLPQFDGVAGIGMRQGDVGFSYDSDWYDWGVDLVHRWIEDDVRRIDIVVGPAFAQISQTYSLDASGRAGANLDEFRQSRMTEDIDEWFFGSRLGVRARRALFDCVDLEGEANFYLLGHHASLSGYQFNVARDAGGANLFPPQSLVIRDSETTCIPRLNFQVGLRFRLTDSLTGTLAYRFDYWDGAATVDNPEVILAPGAWIGQHQARLDYEDLINQSFLFGLVWEH